MCAWLKPQQVHEVIGSKRLRLGKSYVSCQMSDWRTPEFEKPAAVLGEY